MGERSKNVELLSLDRLKEVNPDTLALLRKYKMDMELRELSDKTIYQYESDLNQ